MARYSLFVLKVPLNPNKQTNSYLEITPGWSWSPVGVPEQSYLRIAGTRFLTGRVSFL